MHINLPRTIRDGLCGCSHEQLLLVSCPMRLLVELWLPSAVSTLSCVLRDGRGSLNSCCNIPSDLANKRGMLTVAVLM